MQKSFFSFLPVMALVAVPVTADDNVPPAIQLDELRMIARKLVMDNSELQCRLQELDTIRKLLIEQSAGAQGGAKIVGQRSREVQARADASGLALLTADEQKLQRQLLESIRALQHSEEIQQRLVAQNQRLIALVEELLQAEPHLDASLRTKLLVETEASKRLYEMVRAEKMGANMAAADIETGNLHAAKVREVSRALHLVVLNIGTAQGVRIGMPFAIRRGEQLVALVRAADVRENITGALVERVEKKEQPQPGDAARVAPQ